MIKKNRDISIFNMSALDLFASALGAFILLFIILLPYYLKVDKALMAENQQLQQSLAAQQAIAQALAQEKQQLQQQVKQQQEALDALQDAVKFALLGITTQAKSYVLVIDMSGSMQKYSQIMMDTVQRILQPLGSKHQLQIIGYQGDQPLHFWQPQGQLMALDAVQKADGLSYASGLASQFSGGTPTQLALEAALASPAEAIILLTDGSPNGDPDAIVRLITGKNAGQKEIHTVALGEYYGQSGFVAFLQALAKQNRGFFVGISN